jgi:uncharacterized membrane protein
MNTEIRFLAQHLLHAGLGPLSERDRRVIARVARRVHTARDLNRVFEARSTLGQRLADRVAAVGGSWGFIAGFGLFLAIWALLNVVVLAGHAFDPYPFVFLNLLLSMLAALQAPIIMMSQNRQAAKDRLAAALDYEVNVKAETSIALLHDKVDRLQDQIERLLALEAARLDEAGTDEARIVPLRQRRAAAAA